MIESSAGVLPSENLCMKVCELTMQRMRSQQLHQADVVKSLQEKMDSMETAGIPVPCDESGVAITQPMMRKTRNRTAVKVVSRQLQTNQSSFEVETIETDLGKLQEKYSILSQKFEEDSKNFQSQLKEKTESLSVAVSVANSLLGQLGTLQGIYEEARIGWIEEKSELSSRLLEKTSIANEVPRLVENLSQSEFENQNLRHQRLSEKEQFDAAMSKSLQDSLQTAAKTENDCRISKLSKINGERFQLQDQVKKLKIEKDSLKQRQRETFEKLDTEFANMQREFESTVQRYEADKLKIDKEFRLREEQCKIYRSVLNSLNQAVAMIESAAESPEEFGRVKPAIEQLREIIDSAGSQIVACTAESTLAGLKVEVEKEENAATVVLSEPLNAAYREVTTIVKQQLEAISESECETWDEVSSIGDNYELAKEEQVAPTAKNLVNFGEFDGRLAELQKNLRRIVESPEAPTELQEIAKKSCKLVENLREKALGSAAQRGPTSQIKSILDEIRTESNLAKNAKDPADVQEIQERLKLLVRDLAGVNLVPDFDQISFETPRESMTSLNSVEENEIFAKKLKRYQNLQEKQTLVKQASELKSRLAALANCQLNTSDDFHDFTEELEKLCLENPEVRQEIQMQSLRDSAMQNSQTISQWLELELQKEKEDLSRIAEWYKKDRQEMEKQIDLLNSQMKFLSEEKSENSKNFRDLHEETEKLRQQYQQLWDELNMMRVESLVEPEILTGILAKSQSETKIPSKIAESVGEIRTKAGMILEEVVSLEKKFRAAKYQKQILAADFDEIRGELEINRAEKKCEKDKFVAYIESLTGERFPYESGEWNFVSDLQENLEIKKRELAEISRKYEEDCRQLREQIQAATQQADQQERIDELQRRIYNKDEEIKRLKADERAKLIDSMTQADDPSEIFLRNQLQQYKEDLQRTAAEIQARSANFEQTLDDVRAKLHLTSNMLNEKENCVKILEHEIKSLEVAMQHEQSLRAQEKAHFEALLLHVQQEKTEIREQLAAEFRAKSAESAESAESDVARIENLWKQELQTTTTKFENHVDLLMRDIQAQKSCFQAKVQDLQEMLRCTKSIIEDKENCISLLEKEIKSFEVAKKNSENETKRQIDELNERIEILAIERDHLRQLKIPKSSQESKHPGSPESKKSPISTIFQHLGEFSANLPQVIKNPLKQQKSSPGDLADVGINTELYGVEIDQTAIISDYEARISQLYAELRLIGEENERLKELRDLSNFAEFHKPPPEVEQESTDGEEPQPEIHRRILTAPIIQRYEQRVLELQRKLAKFELQPAFEEENARLQHELAMAVQEVETTRNHFVEINENLQQEIVSLRNEIAELASRESESPKLQTQTTAGDVAQQELIDLRNRVADLESEIAAKEANQQDMYLALFRKGQEAATVSTPFDIQSVQSDPTHGKPKVHRSQQQPDKDNMTEDQILLRFLRDATYYFLISKEPRDHLLAIMNILKFNSQQRQDVIKARRLNL